MFPICSSVHLWCLAPRGAAIYATSEVWVNFSVPQWLASFVLDAVIKSVLCLFAGGLVDFDGSVFPYILAGIGLSLLHFGCLIVGNVAAVAAELRPQLKFWLGLLCANVLFGIIVNTFLALRPPPEMGRSVFELSAATEVFIATNLLAILAVYASGCIFPHLKRS
jgi:hypothetical protein